MALRDVDPKMHLDMEDGTSVQVTGADVYNLISNSGHGILVLTVQYLKQTPRYCQDY